MKIPLELDGLSKRDLVRVILSQDQKIEYQSKKIEDLERRLLAYENAHTPPSKQMHYPKRLRRRLTLFISLFFSSMAEIVLHPQYSLTAYWVNISYEIRDLGQSRSHAYYTQK